MREHILYGALAVMALSAADCTVTATTATSPGCNQDTTVQCTNGAYGFSCPTGSLSPDLTDSALTCSIASPVGGLDEYCCAQIVAASGATCVSDHSVSGCAAGSYGFSCTGTDSPEADYSGIVCSTGGVSGANSQGVPAMLYCCAYPSSSTPTGGCTLDSAVSCTGGASGYSCTAGSQPPDSANSSLLCSTPQPAGTTDQYCCAAIPAASSSTCQQDQSVTGCVGSYGFACTGTDTPASDFSGVTCGNSGVAGTNSQGVAATLYCCTLGNSVTDAGGSCSVGADTGTQACDDCVTSQCCAALTTCDTASGAGVDDAGSSGCEQFIACVLSCVAGNASVAGESMSACEDECNPSDTYSTTDVASANAVFQCMASSCSQPCQ
ncbi:MAG: hypothetical protein ABTD50_09305 [Polyangiaceae bacterium]